MKTSHILLLGFLASRLAASAAYVFDSGSTGTYGELNVTTNTTLELPLDGIFHCTTISVAAGATLRFNRNLNNTPVYLLATGDVNIAGVIDVSGSNSVNRFGGAGGPGGFDGGFGGDNGMPPGNGYGPGRGKAGINPGISCGGSTTSAGAGSYATAAAAFYLSTNKGTVYGSALLVPLLGGSGGGGASGASQGGGGGGGAILISSNTRIDASGAIRANGGEGNTNNGSSGFPFCSGVHHINPGSGGGIRLVAPVVAGSGSLSATGPTLGYPVENHGRIRIDGLDLRNLNLGTTPLRWTGSYMVAIPSNRLDIINVAGTNIVEGFGPVTIQLPNDSPTNQTVTVQARNFGTNNLLITVALIPESGPATTYQASIDNQSANPASVIVPVGLPTNTKVTISAWTRP